MSGAEAWQATGQAGFPMTCDMSPGAITRDRLPRQMDAAGDWSDYMPFTSLPLSPLSCYSLCSADSWLTGCWRQGLKIRLISLPTRLSYGTSSLARSTLHSSTEWTSDKSKVSWRKIHSISSCWTCYMSPNAQASPGKPMLRRAEAMREEEERSKRSR